MDNQTQPFPALWLIGYNSSLDLCPSTSLNINLTAPDPVSCISCEPIRIRSTLPTYCSVRCVCNSATTSHANSPAMLSPIRHRPSLIISTSYTSLRSSQTTTYLSSICNSQESGQGWPGFLCQYRAIKRYRLWHVDQYLIKRLNA